MSTHKSHIFWLGIILIIFFGVVLLIAINSPKRGAFNEIDSSPLPKKVKNILKCLHICGRVDYQVSGVFNQRYLIYADCDADAAENWMLFHFNQYFSITRFPENFDGEKRKFPRETTKDMRDLYLFIRPGDRIIDNWDGETRVTVNSNSNECKIMHHD